MARSFGRLFTSIWDDDDFRPLSVGAKLMYGFLISQDDIAHSGIIHWLPRRWAKLLGEPPEDVLAWLKELEETRYIVTDDEVGELLVRSLIRRDDIWKQPNVFKAAASSARNSKSSRIKGTLYYEIRRLELVGTGRETHAIRSELLSHLEPFANPSPNPPEGFPNGSGGLSDGSADPRAERSPTLSEAQANGSAGPTDKGSGYGPVLEVPLSPNPSPSPAPAAEPQRGLWPSAVPDVQAEGEDSQEDENLDLPELVARVRSIRPDWSTGSIERALKVRSVRERPWPLTCRAFVIVASDPETGQPGRLAHDGPWWHQAPAPKRATRLPWCGDCDERTRMVGWDSDEPEPCPRCNPRARAS